MSGWVKKVNLIIFALQLYTHTHLRAARALWLQHFVLFGLSCWNVSFPRAAEECPVSLWVHSCREDELCPERSREGRCS